MADKNIAPLPFEPADNGTTHEQLWGFSHASERAAEDAVRDIVQPILTQKMLMPDGSRSHPYNFFLGHGNYRMTDVVEKAMQADPKAARYLPELYNMRTPQGTLPIWHYAKHEKPDWPQVEKMLRAGVEIENIDGKGTSLVHLVANLPEAPPESVMRLLNERPREDLVRMLTQHDRKGMLPYHVVRNAATLKWMIALDEGAGLNRSSEMASDAPLSRYTAASDFILGARCAKHGAAYDQMRGRINDREAVPMVQLVLNCERAAIFSSSERVPLENLLQHLQSNTTSKTEGLEQRLAVMKQVYTQTRRWINREPAPGDFEMHFLQDLLAQEKPDPVLVKRLLKDTVEAGGNPNAVYADWHGNIAGSLFSDTLRSRRQNVPMLLAMKGEPDWKKGKDFRVSPDSGLFNIPYMYVGDDAYKSHLVQADAINMLREAGAKVTRSERGWTPVMYAINADRLSTVYLFLHHDLVSDKAKPDAAKELRTLIDRSYSRRKDELREMIDAWEHGKSLPNHIPPPPPHPPAPDISMLVEPSQWPKLQNADAELSLPAGGGIQKIRMRA